MKLSELATTILLWTARILAGMVLLFVLHMIGGHILSDNPNEFSFNSWKEVGIFLFFPTGTSLGLLLAFKREGLGGAIALSCLIGLAVLNPESFSGSTPFFILLSIPPLLFLVYWLLIR